MNWENVALGDCCEIISGATPDTNRKEFWDGDIFWVTPKDLSSLTSAYIHTTPRKITKLGHQNCSAKILPVNSVLFSSRAPIGHVAINIVPMCTNQGFKSFVPDTKRVFSKYLFYWLKANVHIFENLGNGATFKEVSKTTVSNVHIPLPPLPEQKRIAEVLDKADALREKRCLSLQKLYSLLQSVFLEMFGDPVKNPKCWIIKPLKELTHLITDGVHAKPNYTESGVPFISVKDITTGKLYFENCKFVAEEDHKVFTRRCKAEFQDILYTKVGATYGRAVLVNTKREFSLYVSVALIKPKHAVINASFLEAVMNSVGVKRQADKSIKGAGVPDLHLIEIKNFLVPVPSMDIQNEFVNKIASINNVIEKQKQQLKNTVNLFQSLQQKAFKGELFNDEFPAVESQEEKVWQQTSLF